MRIMCEHEGHHHGRDCGCEGGGHGQRHGGHEQDCCCDGSNHGRHDGDHQQDCGCGGTRFGPGRGFVRHFPTRAERIARLEEYLRDLQTEAKAVEERIAELKAMG